MLLLPGCAWVDQRPKTIRGAAAGATAGAIAGAVIEGRRGAVWGTVLGSLAGAAIGAHMDRQDRPADETEAIYEYDRTEGIRIEGVAFRAEPATLTAGQQVELHIEYAVMLPDPRQNIVVTERRIIRYDGKQVADASVQITRHTGTYASVVPIILPATAEPGEYECTAIIQAGTESVRLAMTFAVQ